MNTLLKRILIGIPAAVLVLFITHLGGWYFAVLGVILMLFLQREMCRLLRNAGFQSDLFFPYIIGLFIILLPWLPYKFELAALIFILFIALQVFKRREYYLQALVTTLFAGIYIPFGLLCVILLRTMVRGEAGFFLTVTFLLMLWGNDTLAYLGGQKWGRRLLAPDISPKKTWEGFFFGFLGAGIGLVVMLLLFYNPSFHWIFLVPSIIIISVFGPLGDLLESKLKRAGDVKDSSSILPGHGGFFDRMDALVLAAPAFYLYIQFLSIIGIAMF